ncbi:MAG: AAA family ATPase [Armatimonadetes bacterium]|nr:AAA family ATPase [Armatimonadota bacterium]
MASIDNQIASASVVICTNIEKLSADRALLSQNILAQLRNLVEAVAVRLHRRDGNHEFEYALVGPAMDWVGSGKKQINFLHRFHRLLQMSSSHYTLEGDPSERLMLKYFEYLLRIRTLTREVFGFEILHNLESFPVDLDPSLHEYHRKIAERIDFVGPAKPDARHDRYYIHKVRPFFINGRIFYEVTFTAAVNNTSKFDRLIAFTSIDITEQYSANLTLVQESIEVLGFTMPIWIIQKWEVSIRPCELINFAKILGQDINVGSGDKEYRSLMQYLTATEGSLLNLMDISDTQYLELRDRILNGTQKQVIFPALERARKIIRKHLPGTNVLRYLLLQMNNRIIKLQSEAAECGFLSNLKLSSGCKPFDEMPFCTSLRQHNPRFSDLFASIDATGRTHELLVRRVKNNVERHGLLYTPVAELESFGEVDQLIATYNGKLYKGHGNRFMIMDKGHVFIREYEEGTVSIIRKLQEFAGSGIGGHGDAVDRWLDETPLIVDDVAKKAALKSLFEKSRVALVYGAAGTGKSTMVNYIANYLNDRTKLLLAHTNPAVDNLKRKVVAQNTWFRTVSSQKSKSEAYDILIIDECSTVSNADLLKVLENTSFKLLVLVGDVFQIEAIQFGNWFSIIRHFLPRESVFELTRPFRTDSEALLGFWSKVRNLEDGIEESIAHNQYSTVLDESLFTSKDQDEITLCLNYDGLYGINNINRFLQSSNAGKSVSWGVATYKVGDPVLFNESTRFKPLIYNNLKGRITGVQAFGDRIQFEVELDRAVTELDVDGVELRYLGGSSVQFDVLKARSTDDDDDMSNAVVPFQVAYAVSIHKAQGLEYDSVKVVVTEANEEDITHNILYTAITRTRKHLKIYWTPETQHAVLSCLERRKSDKDVALLKARQGW